MAGPVTEPTYSVLVVTEDGASVPEEVAGALANAADGDAAETVAVGDLDRYLEGNDRQYVVVLVGEPTLSASAQEALTETDTPVVAYSDHEPTAAYVDGYVERGSSGERLLAEVERAREGETRRQLRAARRRVTRLHEAAAEIAAIDSVDELFELAVEVAGRVLSFDHCAVGVDVDGTELVARERSTDWLPRRVPIEGTLAGQAYRRGETVYVAEVASERLENSRATGSSITVPFGGDAVFQAISRRTHAFDETDRELAELLAMHVGQAYERLRAQTDLTRRERVMAELHEAAPRLVDAGSEDELFELTVEIAQRVLSFDRSCVYTAEEDRFRRRATSDPRLPTEFERGFGAFEHSHSEGESLVVDDIVAHEIASSHDGESRSLVSVPFAGDAVFQAVTDETGAFDDSDLEFAELLVSYATATRERIRSEAALRDARETIERLHVATAELAGAESEDALVERAIRAARDVLSFDKSTLSLRRGDKLVPVDADGNRPEGARPMGLDEGVAGKTYQTGESVVIGDLTDDDDAAPVRSEYRSAVSIPLGDLGVFQAVATEANAFDDDDLNNAELLMAHVAVSLERVRTQADLRAERDRLSALFENVPDAAISFELVDGDPVFRAVNSAFEDAFGYGDEVVGEYVDDYIVPDDAQAEAEAEEFNERLHNGESLRKEVRRGTADGVRDFLMYVVPLELGSENVGGYAIYSDITERRERERALRRQNERLDEFASVVSHDLRNPLSVAEGYLDLARETGDDEHLETVADAVGRMRDLIDDLLTLARDGRVVGDTDRTDIDEAAERAWATVDTGDATFEAESGVVVDADPDRLGDLFGNLFRNAVEHGGDAPTVRVEATDDGFAVADDGPGVSPENRESAFEIGYTTADDGTGFGLAIVRRIAEAHGWDVELTEDDTGGARFEFDTGEGEPGTGGR
ncbi:GAF domain-containing protein [Halobaculum sp. CBA1158]|uniref:sensor histidine kinase n=1 Tax=Halobaculum sp. CBA1158 TaxID=2904243 RepID=UPI001F21B3A5|nr:GAF domain-containing protein [Halobaculum sp. CBA1158]UIP00161.1 GAF domain-containing protein [Halobaculum sp. CBA1158]